MRCYKSGKVYLLNHSILIYIIDSIASVHLAASLTIDRYTRILSELAGIYQKLTLVEHTMRIYYDINSLRQVRCLHSNESRQSRKLRDDHTIPV
jgi:hypothetical protein